jgi:hypothetical protein
MMMLHVCLPRVPGPVALTLAGDLRYVSLRGRDPFWARLSLT